MGGKKDSSSKRTIQAGLASDQILTPISTGTIKADVQK